MVDPTSAIVGGGGAVVGALGGVFLAQFYFKRMVDQYDIKHKEHDQKFEKLVERFGSALTELKTKLAVLEVTVADAKNLRTDIKQVEGRMAIQESKTGKAHQRIDQVKDGIALLRSDIDNLKSVM